MKNKNLLLVAALSAAISGCSVYDGAHYHQWYGTYNPSLSNGYAGIIAYEPGADVTAFMQNKCAQYGGLDFSSVRDGTAPKMIGNNLGFVKQYRCYGPRPSPQNSAPITSNTQNLTSVDDAKRKCTDLGFKAGTESFGKCVLQLSK